MSFLAEICEASRRRPRPAEQELRRAVLIRPAVRSLRAALSLPGRRFIAEVKRASPSRGAIAPGLDAAAQARAYAAGGAAAISVLTEPSFFNGSLADLSSIAGFASVPILRKDFLVEPWQVLEARAAGADAVLLIVRALPGDALREMVDAVEAAQLEALVEVHDGEELERAAACRAGVIGINARNLDTLEVDLTVVERLLPRVPPGAIAVAESGIAVKADVDRLATKGARCFLVGEALVRSSDPSRTLREWSAA